MKKVLFLLLGLSLIANVYLIYESWSKADFNSSDVTTAEKREMYPYLARRILLDKSSDRLINFVNIRQKLRNTIDPYGTKVGMYFEYLPSGVSVGINDRNGFFLASLMKIPLVMYVYKQVEEGKLVLDKSMTIEKVHIDNRFGNLWQKGEGAKITVNDAVHYMILDSDNTAYQVMFDYFEKQKPNFIAEVFDYLDVPRVRENF